MKSGVTPMIVVCALALGGCSGLKYATTEKPLFTGYEVVFTTAPEADPKGAQQELEAVVIPEPRGGFLGFRPLVALYNMTGEPKRPGKGLKHLLKHQIGVAPAYLKDVPVNDIDAALANRMNNRGYFSATATHEVIPKGTTAHIRFTVVPGRVHRLRHILYADTLPAVRDSLYERIARADRNKTIKSGDPYHLQALIDERARVAATLRNAGYYRMTEDELEFAADTSAGDHQVDVRLRVKASTTARESQRYTIGSVYVHGDYDELLPPNDTSLVDSVRYINYLNMYRPHTITPGVFIQPGAYYSERRVDATRQYLSSYGVFSSTIVELTDDSLRAGILKADVILTPQKRFSLFTELNAMSKSNNFAGPGVKVGFKDRDLFRGAEVFTADLNGRFETQIAGPQKGTNAYELGGKVALAIPRLLLLGRFRTARSFAPTTRVELGYGLFRRIGLYGLESANLGYSYVWRQNRFKWHDLRVPEVSYNSLYYASDEFNAFLDDNPAIRRSFEQQFIVGTGYTYTRTTQRGTLDRSWWLFSVGGDEGGNFLSLFFRTFTGERPEEGYRLFDQRYAQYLRLRGEARWFQEVGTQGAQVATRLLASAGFPYGNSTSVPYVKQFFSGGTNSLRAFPARSVGPGTYSPEQNLSDDGSPSTFQVDQVGDIKFEVNAEYRFTISGIVKGALFVDAGNVWLQSEDPQRPGGAFRFDKALDELAVGTGLGLRIDPEVIVIRLDLATPLRRPDLPQGDRWVFDDQRSRLFDNFILNIAIGYPF